MTSMSTNTLRTTIEPRKESFFSWIERNIRLEAWFEDGIPVKYLPHILYITILMILYIGNSHYAEKTIRKIDILQTEVEDLRADFTTLKADYMFASKQSEVAKRMYQYGIYESAVPPHKIVIKKGEY